MKRRGPWLLLGLLAAVLVGGLTWIFRQRLAQGDVFPPYSSLRADPLGTRVFHDSLARLPEMRVERYFKPVTALESGPPRTLILGGVPERLWDWLSRDDYEALNRTVRHGSRLVVALRPDFADEPWEAPPQTKPKKEDAEKAERKQDPAKEGDEGEKKENSEGAKKSDLAPTLKIEYVDLRRVWGIDLKHLPAREPASPAVRENNATRALPDEVGWHGDLHFVLEPSAEWSVLYRREGRPVVVERKLGRGTLVFAADSYWLSNEALQRHREPGLLAWLIGPHTFVVFDETHLGVRIEPGVAALARRYGLSGAFFTVLLLAALFVWRRMATFVPPAELPAEVALSYHPAAGLEALLRRAVGPGEVIATCLEEWRATAREADRVRVESALAKLPKGATPTAKYNAALRALKKR